MIKLALTKGRIENEAVKLLSRAGYDCSELDEDKRGRKLIFRTGGGELEIVLAKAADVLTYVGHGVCDAGIMGSDTIAEQGSDACELLDLGFGRCKFALAGKVGGWQGVGYRRLMIASKYPNVTRLYFAERGADVEVVKIEGSVELAPLLGLADAIVDIVETGSTLKANGLEVYEEISDISARLIFNMASIKLKKSETDEFVKRIKTAIGNK
jgi:ATP phosphoribosyltransferase